MTSPDLNSYHPDLIIEQLAEKAGSCFYPMEIVTSAEGPLEEIINFFDLLVNVCLLKINFLQIG